jgi:hypothetical protein
MSTSDASALPRRLWPAVSGAETLRRVHALAPHQVHLNLGRDVVSDERLSASSASHRMRAGSGADRDRLGVVPRHALLQLRVVEESAPLGGLEHVPEPVLELELRDGRAARVHECGRGAPPA